MKDIKKENYEYCKRIAQEIESCGDLSEYFNESALDVVFIANQDKSYKAVRVAVTLGGPNVYIDTEKRAVCLYCFGDEERYFLDDYILDQINELFEELWNF